MSNRALAATVFVPFAVFSLWVGATHGALGFLTLAGREPWALQMLLDLFIALTFTASWMVVDARRRGITVWPYIVATYVLGSFGPLAYLFARSAHPRGVE